MMSTNVLPYSFKSPNTTSFHLVVPSCCRSFVGGRNTACRRLFGSNSNPHTQSVLNALSPRWRPVAGCRGIRRSCPWRGRRHEQAERPRCVWIVCPLMAPRIVAVLADQRHGPRSSPNTHLVLQGRVQWEGPRRPSAGAGRRPPPAKVGAHPATEWRAHPNRLHNLPAARRLRACCVCDGCNSVQTRAV